MKHIQVVSVRLVRESTVSYEPRQLTGSKHAYQLFRQLLENLDREAVWVACVNTKSEVNCLSQVSLGSLDSSSANPREVFKVAILSNAAAIIIAHNHPSGDPTPSPEDHRFTQLLKEAGTMMGMKLLDHLILGEGSYYSFADSGTL